MWLDPYKKLGCSLTNPVIPDHSAQFHDERLVGADGVNEYDCISSSSLPDND